MGNKNWSSQSSSGSNYEDGTETLTEEEQEQLGDLSGEDAYDPPDEVDEALDKTMVDETTFDHEVGEMEMLDDPDAATVDWDEPAPSPEEVDAFESLEETPVFGTEHDPQERLANIRKKTLVAGKKHLKQLNNNNIAEETADVIGAIGSVVPSGGQSSISPAAGVSQTYELALMTREDIGNADDPEERRKQHEKTIKHEMMHATFEAYGYSVKDNSAADRYDPEQDNFVEVRNPSDRHRLQQVDSKAAPVELDDFVRAVNRSWYKMQQAGKDGEFDKVSFDPSADHSGYSATVADETATTFHQIMQTDDLEPQANWFYEHGQLTETYTKLFDPCDRKKGAISYLHQTSPEESPFDEDPYPDSKVVTRDKSLLEKAADGERYEM